MVGPGGGVPLENANPLIYRRSGERPVTAREEDDELPDSIDDREIFDILPGGRSAGGRDAGRGASVPLSLTRHISSAPLTTPSIP